MIDTRERLALDVRGVVQGVGFRPFVYRLARELGLGGHVGNDSARVFIEVEGPAAAVAEFVARLESDAPPLARVERVTGEPVPPTGEAEFTIRPSEIRAGHTTLVSPDTAVCDDCLAEMNDPSDRRYRHPFITCTNCGPRFTIIEALPYDRPNTTMAGFPMCDACRAEYEDIDDRRHHAQPICCHDCGPILTFEPTDEPENRRTGSEAALAAARRALTEGRILAVKGLGGYHLVCDAGSEEAVAELRRRKHRPDKPLAVMARDLSSAHRLVHLDEAEIDLLTSPARPIVLARRRSDAPVTGAVAPGDPFLGVMLPYTPMHHLLLGPDPVSGTEAPEVVVMTSGNRSGEPICHRDDQVREKLGPMVDGYLTHDRPIHVPCDDSVVRVVAGRELPVRRSRGYCPMPVTLPEAVPPSLGVGGELKNTFCVAVDRHAWVSQHVGDMGDLETLRAFERSLGDFESMYRIEPRVVAVDAHPGYRTRIWAEQRQGSEVTEVQHHHAHVATALAEHGIEPGTTVLGFVFDGTGYGDDGAIWGGEVLLADRVSARRVAHLSYVDLGGGDAAIRHPVRSALSHLRAAGIDWSADLAPVAHLTGSEGDELGLTLYGAQLERGVNCVPTSSMGRLFDAVASICGLRHSISFEAQAALELEAVARTWTGPTPRYRFEFDQVPDWVTLIDPSPLVGGIVQDLRMGVPVAAVAHGFHLAVADLVLTLATDERWGLPPDSPVVLSGGVFQNALLVETILGDPRAAELDVLTHRLLPPNDGGLALGQLWVATAQRGPGSEREPHGDSRTDHDRVVPPGDRTEES